MFTAEIIFPQNRIIVELWMEKTFILNFVFDLLKTENFIPYLRRKFIISKMMQHSHDNGSNRHPSYITDASVFEFIQCRFQQCKIISGVIDQMQEMHQIVHNRSGCSMFLLQAFLEIAYFHFARARLQTHPQPFPIPHILIHWQLLGSKNCTIKQSCVEEKWC